MSETRRADATWEGDLLSGAGAVTAATSGAFGDLATSWASRTEAANGLTSPEELLAAAHAACFSMALSSTLAKAGHRAERLAVSAEVTADKLEKGWTVISSALTVRGVVPGIDQAAFATAAEAAKDGCPISRAMAGNVTLSVDAALEG